MEQRLLAKTVVGRDRRVFLPGVELDTAIHRIGQFERGRKVDLNAAVIGVGQRGIGISGDVMPEKLGREVHRVAGGETSLLDRPGGQPGGTDGLGQLVGLRFAGGVSDILGAPYVEIEAGR